MRRERLKTDVTTEAAKLAPPAIVAAWTLNDVVLLATLAYVALQAAYLIWKWRREYRKGRRDEDR